MMQQQWTQVALSKEIKIGKIKTIRLENPIENQNEELVLYRGSDGQVRALNAHCPHLGAHLGAGGQVIGNQIRCPFHGWTYDGDGKCAKIPYCEKIPPGAKMKAWPLQEIDGVISIQVHPIEMTEEKMAKMGTETQKEEVL